MPDLVHGGLTVHAYAAVVAATGEGFPLEIVLEHLGISLQDWPAIDEAWADALAEDVEAEGPLSGELEAALLRAQETYRRPIPPLDDDVSAWIRFFRAWTAAEDGDAFLAERGIQTTDVVRLQRAWSTRLEQEPALQKQVAALLGEPDPRAPTFKKPAPLELRLAARRSTGTMRIVMPQTDKPGPLGAPSILAAMPPSADGPLFIPARVAPQIGIEDGLATAVETRALVIEEDSTDAALALEPPPDSDATMQGASPYDAVRLGEDFELPPPESVMMPVPSSVSEELTLTQYASLRAELEVFPENEEAIFAKYGLASLERRGRVDATWQERLGNETETYAEWRQLYRHFSEHWAAMARVGAGS
jgi:hypothetical protein